MALIESVLRDARHAARLLAKAPGFSVAVVATLGLGIGANTAIFSLVKAVLFEPLPYRAPDRLVAVWEASDLRGTTHLSVREVVSYGDLAGSFEQVAGYVEGNANLTGGEDDPERVRAGVVTVNLFDTLGVAPILGRTFASDDSEPGTDVVVLSQGLWERRYGGARDLIGRTIPINGRPRTVVGIMPESFRLPLDYRSERPTEVWLPLPIDRANLGAWGSRSYFAIARLKEGVSVASASSELAVITDRWVQAGYDGFRGGLARRDAIPVERLITGAVTTPLFVLTGAVIVVLLIACANVINLLLARADARRREVAIRSAIGAGRRQLIAQLLTESTLLASLGGLFGLVIAQAALRLVVFLRPAHLPRVGEVTLDLSVLAFTAVLSLLCGLIFGLVPAYQIARPQLTAVLNDGGRSGAGRKRLLRRALASAQLACSVVLVVVAGLLVRTLVELYRVDLGFDPRHVLTLQLQLPATDYPDPASVVRFYRQLTERLQQLPGATHAAAVRIVPLARTIGDYSITLEGRPTQPGENPNGDFQWVTPGYFEAMGMKLMRGRFLTPADAEDSPLVVVINDTMASRYWPGEDAIGKRFHMGGGTALPPVAIVGIVRGTRHNAVVEDARAEMFLPHAQLPRSVGGAARTMDLVVKTAGDPLAMVGSVRSVVSAMNRTLPIADIRTIQQITDASLATPRFAALLLGLFAGLALTLAAIGTYATISLFVMERSQEIGIRMALGAERRTVLTLVLRQGLTLTAFGMGGGLLGALMVSRLVETMLYGISPFDAATFAGVTVLLTSVAMAACFVPARRAAGLDPVATLRANGVP